MKQVELAAAKVLPSILEGAAFLFSDEIPEDERPGEEWAPIGVTISWTGPHNGSAFLWVDPALCGVLAANMLGVEEGDPEAQAKGKDAIKELLNMVLGNCLTEAFGLQPVFHLGIPSVVSDAPSPEEAMRGLWWSVEGKVIMFLVKAAS